MKIDQPLDYILHVFRCLFWLPCSNLIRVCASNEQLRLVLNKHHFSFVHRTMQMTFVCMRFVLMFCILHATTTIYWDCNENEYLPHIEWRVQSSLAPWSLPNIERKRNVQVENLAKFRSIFQCYSIFSGIPLLSYFRSSAWPYRSNSHSERKVNIVYFANKT